MHERSRARSWALQALYAAEVRAGECDAAPSILRELAEEQRIAPENRFFADVLVRIVAREMPRLDTLIEEQLTNWRLDRLTVIDRNILRLGVAELLFVEDVPTRITVQEMIRLAERFGTDESPRFVNAVLDSIARRTVPEKVAEGG